MRLTALVVMMVAACANPQPPVVQPKPLGACTDALADAKATTDMGWKDEGDKLDANADGIPECVLRGCYGGNCDVLIYVREPGGVRRIAKLTAAVFSDPHCVDRPAKKFCRLSVGVFMIHGETQETFWRYSSNEYIEDGFGALTPGP